MGLNKLYGFITDNGTSLERNLRFLSYPEFEYGEAEFETIKIPGRNDSLTMSKGIRTDTIIKNEMEFVGISADSNEAKKYQILAWLKEIKEVSYTDSLDKYFKVKQVKIDDLSRKYKIYNNVDVQFICDSGIYLRAGDVPQNLTNGIHLVNAYSESAPVYKITGEGVLDLKVNGKTFKANVGQNLTIDTDLRIAYRQDGELQNTAVTGDYDDLILKKGDNYFEFPVTFKIQIIPRWRLLL